MNTKKHEFRLEVRDLFLHSDHEELLGRSKDIIKKIEGSSFYQSATTIAVYEPMHDEPDIS